MNVQTGGGPEEDTSGGFAYGGWAEPYDDDILGAALQKQMNVPFDLLVGRPRIKIRDSPATKKRAERLGSWTNRHQK